MFDFILSYKATVILGATILGFLTALMGSFSYVRGENLLGDAISHAALPGICLVFLLYPGENILVLLMGAAISGLVAMGLIILIQEFSRIKTDTTLALILSVFFGSGMVLMGLIQRNFGEEQAGLESFIFGQAASFLRWDLYMILALLVFILVILKRYFYFFKLISFDPEFFHSLGLPFRKTNFLLNSLLILVIIFGLKMVGVVLMSALLIGPAALARLWTDDFLKMLLIASLVGGFSGCLGTLLSIYLALPTGPLIVLVLMVLVLTSFLIAPGRGIIARRRQQKNLAKEVRNQSLLRHIEELAQEDGWISIESLRSHRKFQAWKPGLFETSIEALKKAGKIQRAGNKLKSLGKE